MAALAFALSSFFSLLYIFFNIQCIYTAAAVPPYSFSLFISFHSLLLYSSLERLFGVSPRLPHSISELCSALFSLWDAALYCALPRSLSGAFAAESIYRHWVQERERERTVSHPHQLLNFSWRLARLSGHTMTQRAPLRNRGLREARHQCTGPDAGASCPASAAQYSMGSVSVSSLWVYTGYYIHAAKSNQHRVDIRPSLNVALSS